MSADPFASLIQYQEKEETSKEDQFSKLSPYQEEKKLPFQDFVERFPTNVSRSSLRILETGMGIPRDLASVGEIPAEYLVQGLEKAGIGKAPRKLFETAKKYAPYQLLPSSKRLRDFSKSLFGEHFEPKSKGEEFSDEVSSDFASLIFPMPGSQLKPLRSLFTSIGANVAGEGAKEMGLGDIGKYLTKGGVTLASALFKPKGAEEVISNLYNDTKNLLPANAAIGSKELENELIAMKGQMQIGGNIGHSSTAAENSIDAILQRVSNGKISIEDLTRARTKLGEVSETLWETVKDRRYLKTARRNVQKVMKTLDKTIDTYGKKNPEWLSSYRAANHANAIMEQSKKVSNLISKYAGKISKATAAYFGAEHLVPGVPSLIGAQTVAPVAVGYATLKASELMYRLAKDKNLRNYYINVLKSALQDDAPALTKNLKNMDEYVKAKNEQ